MTVLQASPETDKGALFEAGYAIGYFVGSYLIESLLDFLFLSPLVFSFTSEGGRNDCCKSIN